MVFAQDVSEAVTEVLVLSKDVTGVLISAKAVTEAVTEVLVLSKVMTGVLIFAKDAPKVLVLTKAMTKVPVSSRRLQHSQGLVGATCPRSSCTCSPDKASSPRVPFISRSYQQTSEQV